MCVVVDPTNYQDSQPRSSTRGKVAAEHCPEGSGQDDVHRTLVALVHADVVGYSRLVETNDVDSWARLSILRRDLIEPLLGHYGGQIVNAAGDGMLMVFGSATAALRFAVEMQAGIPAYHQPGLSKAAIHYRVGVHIGDVVVTKTDLVGLGIIIAARLQSACPPGAVCVSRAVVDLVQVRHLPSIVRMGTMALRNVATPIEAFALGDVMLPGRKNGQCNRVDGGSSMGARPARCSSAALFSLVSGAGRTVLRAIAALIARHSANDEQSAMRPPC